MRIADFKDNPKILRLYIKNAQVWYDKHKEDGKDRKFTNAIDAMVATLFYSSYNDFLDATYSMFGKRNWKEELEKYFNIDLSEIYYENEGTSD